MAYFRCGGGGHSDAEYNNLMDQLVEETATGPIASFTDGANNIPVKEIICHINPTETGTGEKSPQNPYVIGGHTELNLTQTGSNIWGGLKMANDIVNAINNTSFAHLGENTNGKYVYTLAGAWIAKTYFDKFKENTRYTIILKVSKTNTAKSVNMAFEYTDGTNSSIEMPNTPEAEVAYTFAFTSEANKTVKRIRGNYNSGASYFYYENCALIEGIATVADFAPYNSTTYTTDFGQTVYGGEFVAREGEFDKVTSNLGIYTIPTISSLPILYGVQTVTIRLNDMKIVSHLTGDIIAEVLRSVSGMTHDFCVSHNSNNVFVMVTDDYTVADFNANIAGTKFCYPLATPTEITLPTKTQVNTLLGANNLYHDCNGDIDVTYRANGALYVQEHPITRGLMAARPTEQIQEQEEQQEEKEINKSEDNEK